MAQRTSDRWATPWIAKGKRYSFVFDTKGGGRLHRTQRKGAQVDDWRSIVVTGGSRGWGKGIVLKLAAPKTRIFVNYLNNHGAAKETAETAISQGADAILVK